MFHSCSVISKAASLTRCVFIVFLIATCRIPGPTIEINYYELPPYVYTSGNSQKEPEGLITGVASQSILQCALTCQSFNEIINIVYKEVQVANISTLDTRLQLEGSANFLLPKFEKGKSLIIFTQRYISVNASKYCLTTFLFLKHR